MRRLCIFRREKVYYVKFWNADLHKYNTAISTGKRSQNEAYAKVQEWIRYGFNGRDDEKIGINDRLRFQSFLYYLTSSDLTDKQVDRIVDILIEHGYIAENNAQLSAQLSVQSTKKVEEELEQESRLLLPYLREFWDYDKSPYVREKLAYGQSIGKRHCYEQTKKVHHWEKYFAADTKITDITRETLREFQIALKEKNLAPKSINMILTVGTVAFGWLADRGEISNNPSTGLRKFAGEAKKRDILTHDEVRKIFAVKWDDERSRVGNLLAMTTGMRASEVVALQAADIQEDRLLVRHSWSFVDGLKKPKNGEERVVPLLPEIRVELVNLLMKNPHDSKKFIFYGPQPDKPMNIDVLSKWLTKAYIDITISPDLKDDLDEREKIRKAMLKRGICFHSWRHFYTSSLADRIEMRSVQLATGHKTAAMAEHYANHVNGNHLEAVSKAVSDVYGQILHEDQRKAVSQ